MTPPNTTAVPATRPFDILVYGATGFTGEAVAQVLAKRSSSAPQRWAIGGRDRAKVNAVKSRLTSNFSAAPQNNIHPTDRSHENRIGTDPSLCNGNNYPEVIVVDALTDSRATLAAAFATARVLINCSGPFIRFGHKIVEACIDAGTDYVDISGETQFILGTMLQEHARALERGVLVVSACGFDSVPADLGCRYVSKVLDTILDHSDTHQNRQSTGSRAECDESAVHVTHIESFVQVTPCAVANATTLESALLAVATVSRTRKLRSMLPKPLDSFSQRSSTMYPRLKVKTGIFRDPRASSYSQGEAIRKHSSPFCSLFPGTDATIVKQTYRLESLEHSKSTQSVSSSSYAAYMVIGNLRSLVRLLWYGAICLLLAQFPVGRKIIMQNPELFTGGHFSRYGPTDDQRVSTSVTFDFFGKRYVNGVESARTVVQLSIPRDPGYNSTAEMVVAAAVTLLDERAVAPKGGVVTPAIAFGKTTFLQRLTQDDVIKLSLLKTVVTPTRNKSLTRLD